MIGRTPRTGTGTGTARVPRTATGRAAARDNVATVLARYLAEHGRNWAEDDHPGRPLEDDDAPPESEYPDHPEHGWDEDDLPDPQEKTDGEFIARSAAPLAAIRLWISNGQVQSAVIAPDPLRTLHPVIGPRVQARYQRLRQYAGQLADRVPAVVAAVDLAAAYDAVPTDMSMLAVDSGQVSRDRDLLVALPSGTVPFRFFTWKDSNDDIVKALATHPDLITGSKAALMRTVAADLGVKPGTVEPYVNWLRATHSYPHITRSLPGRFRAHPQDWQDLIDQTVIAFDRAVHAAGGGAPPRGQALKGERVSGVLRSDRGGAVLKRALVGAL